MLQYYSITLFLVAIVVRCSAFVNLDPQRCAHTKLSNDNNVPFYDDFGDTSFNDNDKNSNSNIASLTSRINEVKSVEQAYDGKIARNWSKGVSTFVHILCAPSYVHHLMLILYTTTLTLYIPYLMKLYRIGE